MSIANEWIGRFVRVLIVFRALVLLITLLLLPAAHRTPVVGIAVILAAFVSYVPLRHWSRIAPSLENHPTYLALEVLLATLILAAAGARSPFFYFTLGTAALAGMIYGRRGAIPFSMLLIAAYEFVALEGLPTLHPLHDAQSVVFVPLLYPAALAAGLAARELVKRGVDTEQVLRERTEALAGERERLRVARELHDSLAKTVEGLSMTASVLARRCRQDAAGAGALAEQLAADAVQAAREARALMSDLREGGTNELALADTVRRCAADFAQRSGLAVEVICATEPQAGQEISPATRHELMRILGEALANAQRHGRAAGATVSLVSEGDDLLLSVGDDGCGLSAPVELASLKAAGHFGIAGMHERAHAIGAQLAIEPGPDGGTVVAVRIPANGGRGGGADGGATASRRRRRPGLGRFRQAAIGDSGLQEYGP